MQETGAHVTASEEGHVTKVTRKEHSEAGEYYSQGAITIVVAVKPSD